MAESEPATTFIGDSQVDRAAADAAGWHFIGVEDLSSDFVSPLPQRYPDLRKVEAAIEEL
jgi:hypothetical protein